MWMDLWPLAALIVIYGALYVISRLMNALGLRPTLTHRPGVLGCPPERDDSEAETSRRENIRIPTLTVAHQPYDIH